MSNPNRAAQSEIRKEKLKMKAAGLWDIFSDAVKNFSQNGDGNSAAAIALYAILSAIPLLILTMVAAGAFFSSNLNIQAEIIEVIRNFQPYFSDVILSQLGQMEDKRQVLGWIGVLGLIWLATAIFNAMESALNNIFRTPRTRNFFLSKLMALCMIPAVWLIGGLSVAISYVAVLIIQHPLTLPGGLEIALTGTTEIILRYLVPYLLVVALAFVIYRMVPLVKIRIPVALVGAAVFAVLLEIAKQLFTEYIASYTRYSVIFGSLEAIVIVLVWVFYAAIIFLFCAEMMASYERRDILLLERAFLNLNSGLKMDERLLKRFGHTYPRHSIIFSEGDEGHEMFYVLSGRVRLERAEGDVQKTLAHMGPGQYFGEMAALIDIRRSATAVAAEDCHLAVIDGPTFSALIRESQDVALLMLREFSLRLKNSNASLNGGDLPIDRLEV